MDKEQRRTPYWQDKNRVLFNGNCRSMPEIPDGTIQCCVTSPPYWGLRKYAGEQDSTWGGMADCSHEWGESKTFTTGRHDADIRKRRDNDGSERDVIKETMSLTGPGVSTCTKGQFCSLCGAWRGAYGLEPTVEMYVAHSIEILRGIRRVLRKDGVCFWNVGDSYATVSGGMNQLAKMGKDTPQYGAVPYADGYEGVPQKLKKGSGLKHKDLCLIPFRVAIAAQVDGWWIRSVIIWNKPNPMPESVKDRPTDSYEHILMLTKSAKYYWDAEAVREPQSKGTFERYGNGDGKIPHRNKLGGSARSNESFLSATPDAILPNGRNLRNVWTFPTQPYKGAHFATFPEVLPEKCIKAATPEVGCCSKCGTAWERIMEGTPVYKDNFRNSGRYVEQGFAVDNSEHEGKLYHKDGNGAKTIGWQPCCKCNADKVPSIVLDPFCGSGTTLKVATRLNRRAIGYELSEEYCKLARERNE